MDHHQLCTDLKQEIALLQYELKQVDRGNISGMKRVIKKATAAERQLKSLKALVKAKIKTVQTERKSKKVKPQAETSTSSSDDNE